MMRKILATLGIAVLFGFVVWATLYLTRKPVTQEEATALAIQRLQRSGERLKFDPSHFRGPDRIGIGGAEYVFQWNYSDRFGKVEIVISVDQDGGTEFAFNGDLDRLRTYKRDG